VCALTGRRQRLSRLVAGLQAAGNRAEGPPHCRLVPTNSLDLVEDKLVSGQRAGFVQTKDIHVRERFDGVYLLNQGIAAYKPEGGHRVGDGDHQEEPIGDDAYDNGGINHGVAERKSPDRRREQEQC
jgi:hypothetical protein